MVKSMAQLPSSFRDPSGFMYLQDQILFRQVNPIYREHYDQLISSGLYDELVRDGLLIPHTEVDLSQAASDDAYKVLRPDYVPFISHPHEWSFSQFKDSALVTLEIQKRALNRGMSLKDASAYNIALVGGKPKLIDTLSFERYSEGVPWVAYRQFCQHFLAPIALMHFSDVRLSQLFVTNIDGIPLDLASKLLPFRSNFNLAIKLHIHLHAKTQRQYADKTIKQRLTHQKMPLRSLLGLIDNLESAIRKWKWDSKQTNWSDYYGNDSYTEPAFRDKQRLVEQWITQVTPTTVWDCGANTGEFSRIASKKGILTVSMDFDPGTVDQNYQQALKEKDANIFPIVVDLTVPTPSIGWANQERKSLLSRSPADLVLALALIHHLAITNNVPLGQVAQLFAGMAKRLVIEFVPKGDPKVQTLLANRDDIFPDYTPEGFEAAFEKYFLIEQKSSIQDSQRILYLMRNKEVL